MKEILILQEERNPLIQVDSNYSITYSKLNNTLVTVSPVKSVTNYEYETDINEKKRQISILKPEYLSVVITDLRNIMQSTSNY